MTLGLMAVQEISHWAGLAPLVACAARERKRPAGCDVWLLAAAFAVSFVADQVAMRWTLAGYDNNWWISYVYAPVQYGLFLWLLLGQRAARVLAVGLMVVLGLVSAFRGPLTQPETIVQSVGGLMVAFCVWQNERWSLYRGPLLLYGLGTMPSLVLMAAIPTTAPAWLAAWLVYQGVRLATLGWVVERITVHGQRKGVRAHGRGSSAVIDRRRSTDWHPRDHGRAASAAAGR